MDPLKIHNFVYRIICMPRGRNKELIKARNEKIAQRWYYWTEKQRLRFDDAMKILSQQEFFLSEDRIMCILRSYIKRASGDGDDHPPQNQGTKTDR